MREILFGAAYYDEYMPYDRLDKDIEMMKKAGINTVRIAESTWSTCEPQEGVFDFSHVERVMDAMEEAGINVIIGTPTYAVPAWMVKAHPDVIATTKKGAGIYGARQIMDITNPVYLFYAERVIRKLMEISAHRKCVIGFQVDNETKYYGTARQASICSYDSMAGNYNGNFIMSNRTAYCLGGHMGSVFHHCNSARNFSICDRLSVGNL